MRWMIYCAALLGLAHSQVIQWSRDTIVQDKYQPAFCEGVPELEHICTDQVEFQPSSSSIRFDTIYFVVDTNRVNLLLFQISKNFGPTAMIGHYDNANGYLEIHKGQYDQYLSYMLYFIRIVNIFGWEEDPIEPASPVSIQLILKYSNEYDTLTILGLLPDLYFAPTNILKRDTPAFNGNFTLPYLVNGQYSSQSKRHWNFRIPFRPPQIKE